MFPSTGSLIIAILFVSDIRSARVKDFVGEKLATCATPVSNNYIIQFPGPINWTVENNRAQLYGNFTVTETFQEPLEFTIIRNRCSMNMKSCELFNKLTLPRICGYINDERGIWSTFYKSIEPEFHCPVKPGVYKFNNSTIDLKFFAMYPLEGYRWQSSLKLYSTNKVKKEVYCLSIQFSMRWVRKTSTN